MIYVTQINKFYESINPTVLNILIDDSYSMTPMRNQRIVTDALNEVMIPALEKAHQKRKDVLRVSLGAFSDDKVQSLTKRPGYFKLEELKRQPVTNNHFGGPGLNGGTALYASMVSGIQSCANAAQIIRKQLGCRQVRAELVILTDGDNETMRNETSSDVRAAINDVGTYVNLRVHMAYFKTNVGIDRAKFMSIAQSCGLGQKNCHFWADHGNSHESQRKAFRKLVDILSKNIYR